MKIAFVVGLMALAVVSCGPFIPVTKLDDVPADTMTDALNVRVFRTGAAVPKVTQYLGQVIGNSCKNLMWQPPPSTNDALLRLRVEAAKRGANTVMDVACDDSGNANEWPMALRTMTAGGMAPRHRAYRRCRTPCGWPAGRAPELAVS